MSIIANAVTMAVVYANGVLMRQVYHNGVRVFRYLSGWITGTHCGTSSSFTLCGVASGWNLTLTLSLATPTGTMSFNSAGVFSGTAEARFDASNGVLIRGVSGGIQIGNRYLGTTYWSPTLTFGLLTGFQNAVRSTASVGNLQFSIIGDGNYRFKMRILIVSSGVPGDTSWITMQ